MLTNVKYDEGLKEIVAEIKKFNERMCEETLPEKVKNLPNIRYLLLIACVQDITKQVKMDIRKELLKEEGK
jgi:hypothetical protein